MHTINGWQSVFLVQNGHMRAVINSTGSTRPDLLPLKPSALQTYKSGAKGKE
jgi:hypothetical protein